MMKIHKYVNPIKYFNKLQSYWHERNYNLHHNEFYEAELQKFKKYGFRYDAALAQLNGILKELGRPTFSEADSVHSLLFACIGQVHRVRNVLEIGTFLGEATLLMSRLFPESRITTVDLPDDDPILISTYKREDPKMLRAYKEQQKKNLASTQITFLQTNSFFIPGIIKEKFDLIWIDGGHLYPDIAWDICNAYHLTNKGGWLMCDDVITHHKGFQSEYVSTDSCKVLEYIRARTGEDITYFLKREAPEASANPKKRKYIAVMRRS